MDLVQQISLLQTVNRVVALGTLCALELRAEGSNAGYYLLTSTSSFPFFLAESFCFGRECNVTSPVHYFGFAYDIFKYYEIESDASTRCVLKL